MNTVEQTVVRNGCMLDLTRTEYRLLEYLMHRPRALVSKQELLEHLYDYKWAHDSNVIEAHISNLRRKLNAGSATILIETVRQRGYRLESFEEPLR
jgi:DNA-binding response OmpR family regulator